jgi:hypothetical protein
VYRAGSRKSLFIMYVKTATCQWLLRKAEKVIRARIPTRIGMSFGDVRPGSENEAAQISTVRNGSGRVWDFSHNLSFRFNV